MEIMQRRELWIHTHFVTDCVRLSQAQGREIEVALLPVLRQHHLVYGIHLNALVEITTGMLPRILSGFPGCQMTVMFKALSACRFSSKVKCCNFARTRVQ
jgi:hypothetical protein